MLRAILLTVLVATTSVWLAAQDTGDDAVVRQPAVVVAPTKLNIIYRGVDNPVDIAVPGVPCDQLNVKVSHGRLVGTGCSYVVNVGADADRVVRITVSWSIGDKSASAESLFRVKDPPLPVTCFAGACTDHDTIHFANFHAAQGVIPRLMDFDMDIVLKVVQYRLRILRACTPMFDATVNEARLSPEMREALQGVRSGDEVLLTEIKMMDPMGVIKPLAPLRLFAR
ncbi:MAG TPA: GldM family protein [Flavobacteriales bacterium]|nr:GldM family protein [Flavobacteriales bacterium]